MRLLTGKEHLIFQPESKEKKCFVNKPRPNWGMWHKNANNIVGICAGIQLCILYLLRKNISTVNG